MVCTLNAVYAQTDDRETQPAEERGTESEVIPAAAESAAGRESERLLVLGETPVPNETGTAGIFDIFRVIFVLILAALAIYGIVYLLKKTNRHENPEETYIKLLASLPITAKTNTAVIAVGSRAWLIGISETNISVLAELNDQENIDTMLLEHSRRKANTIPIKKNFLSLLQKMLPLEEPNKTEKNNTNGISSILQKNRDKLRGL